MLSITHTDTNILEWVVCSATKKSSPYFSDLLLTEGIINVLNCLPDIGNFSTATNLKQSFNPVNLNDLVKYYDLICTYKIQLLVTASMNTLYSCRSAVRTDLFVLSSCSVDITAAD